MKFYANRSELLPIIKRCCLVIGRQFLTPEKACILMEADEDHNHVQFTAMGNECILQARLNSRVEQGGKTLMIAGIFQSMLERFGDEATCIETDHTEISIRNAKAGYCFALMDAKKYPVPEPCAPDALSEADGFCEIGAKVLFSAAKVSDALRALNCIHVAAHDGKWSATSCDGYRLTVAAEHTAQTEPLEMLLSVEAMKTVLHVFHGMKHCKIGVHDGFAVFCGPGIVLRARLNEQTYANVKPLLDHFRAVYELSISGDILLDALKQVSAGSKNGAKLILLPVDHQTVRLQFLSGTNSMVTGQTEMDCTVQTELPKDGFCYTYIYLREAAALMQGKDIAVQFDKGGAMMLRSDSELHLLLPIRLPKIEDKPKTTRTYKAA